MTAGPTSPDFPRQVRDVLETLESRVLSMRQGRVQTLDQMRQAMILFGQYCWKEPEPGWDTETVIRFSYIPIVSHQYMRLMKQLDPSDMLTMCDYMLQIIQDHGHTPETRIFANHIFCEMPIWRGEEAPGFRHLRSRAGLAWADIAGDVGNTPTLRRICLGRMHGFITQGAIAYDPRHGELALNLQNEELDDQPLKDAADHFLRYCRKVELLQSPAAIFGDLVRRMKREPT